MTRRTPVPARSTAPPWRVAAGLVLLAMAAPAGAAVIDADVAGHSLMLPVPDGFCTLDRAREFDRELDERLQRVFSARNVYLGAAIDCGELAALEDAPERGFTTYLIWIAEGDGRDTPALYPDIGRRTFVENEAEQIAAVDTGSASQEATEIWQEELDSDTFGVGGLEFGAADSDANAYYVTGVARVEGAAGTVTQAGVTIGTLMHGLHVQAYLYRPFQGPATIASLESDGVALAAALVAANPDSDPAGGLLGSEARSTGLVLLRGALVGALAGGALAGLVWFLRRLRRPARRRFD